MAPKTIERHYPLDAGNPSRDETQAWPRHYFQIGLPVPGSP